MGRARAATLIVSLILTMLPAPPVSAATRITGTVMCVSQRPVVGIWVKGRSWRTSGWADWRPTKGAPFEATFSYTLRRGTTYQVHVGCGGTWRDWATNNKSDYTSANGQSFTCYDTTAAYNRYKWCQRA